MVPSLELPAPTGLRTVALLFPRDPAPPTPPSANAIPAQLEKPPVPPRSPDPPLTAPPAPRVPLTPTTMVKCSPALAMTSLIVTAPAAPPDPPTWSEIPPIVEADPAPPPPPPAPIATTVKVPSRGATQVPLTVNSRMSEGSLPPRGPRGMTVMFDTVESVVAPQAVSTTLPTAIRIANACFGRINLFISLLEFLCLKVAEFHSRSGHAPSCEDGRQRSTPYSVEICRWPMSHGPRRVRVRWAVPRHSDSSPVSTGLPCGLCNPPRTRGI